MTDISHHIPEHLMVAYVSGQLPTPFAIVVAAHISICTECRVAMEVHQQVGGVILDDMSAEGVSANLKSDLLAALDEPFTAPPPAPKSEIYPTPVSSLFVSTGPKWRPLGRGVKQSILKHTSEGSVRLLSIPPGMEMPDHSHGGMEMTLVLQGSFSDDVGRFRRGDVEIADSSVTHTPVADEGHPCICLAATDAPLRFQSLIPRLLQPIFKI